MRAMKLMAQPTLGWFAGPIQRPWTTWWPSASSNPPHLDPLPSGRGDPPDTSSYFRPVVLSVAAFLLDGFLPMPAVEANNLERREIHAFQAARVHIDLIRVRPRHVERMDATVTAEGMLGRP